jgi:uncharacterized protein YbjT (DUF2867 family)
MTTVSVFGGTGFLGRRLVRRLAAEGATLRIAVRSPDRARSVLRAADLDRVTVFRADVHDQASVAAAVAGVDAVVNAVSAYIEKPGVTFEFFLVEGDLPGLRSDFEAFAFASPRQQQWKYLLIASLRNEITSLR